MDSEGLCLREVHRAAGVSVGVGIIALVMCRSFSNLVDSFVYINIF